MEFRNHQEDVTTPPRHEDFVVTPPAAHQGVGDALRTVFTPCAPGLPNEWEELLNRLR